VLFKNVFNVLRRFYFGLRNGYNTTSGMSASMITCTHPYLCLPNARA